MERVVYKHVYNHLHSNKLICEYQSSFLPKHSTVHQLIEFHVYNTILNSLKNKDFGVFFRVIKHHIPIPEKRPV